MDVPVETLAARYWEASQTLRRRQPASWSAAAAFLSSQAGLGGHPLIRERCRRAVTQLNISKVAVLPPTEKETA